MACISLNELSRTWIGKKSCIDFDRPLRHGNNKEVVHSCRAENNKRNQTKCVESGFGVSSWIRESPTAHVLILFVSSTISFFVVVFFLFYFSLTKKKRKTAQEAGDEFFEIWLICLPLPQTSTASRNVAFREWQTNGFLGMLLIIHADNKCQAFWKAYHRYIVCIANWTNGQCL